MTRTYNFWTHWATTDEILEWAIDSFEVTPEEVVSIEEWAMIEDDNGELIITDYSLV